MNVISNFKFTLYAGNTIKHWMVQQQKYWHKTGTFDLLEPKMFVMSMLVVVTSSGEVVVVVVAVGLPGVVVLVRDGEPLLQRLQFVKHFITSNSHGANVSFHYGNVLLEDYISIARRRCKHWTGRTNSCLAGTGRGGGWRWRADDDEEEDEHGDGIWFTGVRHTILVSLGGVESWGAVGVGGSGSSIKWHRNRWGGEGRIPQHLR